MKWPLILLYTALTTFISVAIVGGMIESLHAYERPENTRHCRQELVRYFENLSYAHITRSEFQAWLPTWKDQCGTDNPVLNSALKDYNQALSNGDREHLLPEEKLDHQKVYDDVIRPSFRQDVP